MKRIIFSFAAALTSTIGLSSFHSGKFTMYSCFTVNSGQNLVGKAAANNSQVTYYSRGTALPPKPGYCTGVGFDCLVCFTNAQLTSGLNHLSTWIFTPFQTIRTVGYTRGHS